MDIKETIKKIANDGLIICEPITGTNMMNVRPNPLLADLCDRLDSSVEEPLDLLEPKLLRTCEN